MRHYRPFQNKWYCITHLCIWSSEAGCACDIWSSAMSKIFLVISALGVCVLHSNRCFAETTDKVYNKNMLQAALITFINICLNQKTPDLHSDYWLRFISWVHLWYHTVQDFVFNVDPCFSHLSVGLWHLSDSQLINTLQFMLLPTLQLCY